MIKGSLIKALLGLCFVAMCATGSLAQDEPHQAPTDPIIQLIEDFQAALVAKDEDKALSFLAPGVVLFEGGYVSKDKNFYKENYIKGDMGFMASGLTRKVISQEIHGPDNMKVVMTVIETTGSYGGKPLHNLDNETFVLAYTGNDNWIITHIHLSSRPLKE